MSCLGGEGFKGQMFKKSVDLKKSKLTVLSEQKLLKTLFLNLF
jgi:hypothetical protein